MAYGTVKVDSITFTNGGADQTITVSGIVQSISGDITATGTIQGATIVGTSTVSGATVTGDSGQYGNLNSVSGVFTTQISGATITGDAGNYSELTATSGVFTTQISGATITGNTIQASTVTGISGVYTTQLSGATITGDTGSFTSVTGGVATITSGVFALGEEALPSISFSSDPNTGIYSPGADQLAISTNGTGRISIGSDGDINIDSGGVFYDASTNRLAVGTTSPNRLLEIAGSGGANNVEFRLNATDGGERQITFVGSGSTSQIIRSTGTTDNSLVILQGSNERARIDSSGTFRVKGAGTGGVNDAVQLNGSAPANSLLLDDSGRLLVGTPSVISVPLTGTSAFEPQFQLKGNTGASSNLNVIRTNGAAYLTLTSQQTGDAADRGLGAIAFHGLAGGTLLPAASITSLADAASGTDDMPGRLVFSTTADGASSPTERMRIRADGAVLIGQTTNLEPGGGNTVTGIGIDPGGIIASSRNGFASLGLNRNTSDGNVALFRREGSLVGSVSVTTTATAYNTSSDYRLKENILPVTDGITRLQQLKPSRFNFIADPTKTVDGFLAHEVQTVVPEAITGEKDAVDEDGNPQYQGIDQSKLVPLLTAALQEAVAKIESLEARLTAAGL